MLQFSVGMKDKRTNPIYLRIFLLVLFVLAIVAVYFILKEFGIIDIITDVDRLRIWIFELGYVGPLTIIALMAIAVIINPIPSAPIALAAGAAFGHTWGTLYVITGAASGALGAFWIARFFGYDFVSQLIGKQPKLKWIGSQNTLMGMVFLSRLIPFLSFDLVSYGAGLTPIKTWRFALATLAGLIPASFLLAHFGGEMVASNLNQAMLILLLLGGITVIPAVIIGFLRRSG